MQLKLETFRAFQRCGYCRFSATERRGDAHKLVAVRICTRRRS